MTKRMPHQIGARVWAVGSLAAVSMVLAGCPRPVPVVRPYPPPSAAELAGVLAAQQRTVSSMNARVRATSWLGGDRIRATVMMLVDRPGRLRFEAEVSLQGTVAVLVTDGQLFSFLDTTHNELRRGPACPANVASLIRIPLAPSSVAAILLGDVDVRPARATGDTTSEMAVDWDAARAADVLAIRTSDGWLRVLFQRGRNTPRGGAPPDRIVGAVSVTPDRHTRWRVAFEDFADVHISSKAASATIPLPLTIRFAEGDASFDDGVEIKIKERTLNDPMADNAFVLSTPPGTATMQVACP